MSDWNCPRMAISQFSRPKETLRMPSNAFQHYRIFGSLADASRRWMGFECINADGGSCVGRAQYAVRGNFPQGSRIYRIGDPIKTVKNRRKTNIFETRLEPLLESIGTPWRSSGWRGADDASSGGNAHCGNPTLAGWSDAACGDRIRRDVVARAM